MVLKLIAKGAEAKLYLDHGKLVKHRIEKSYRIEELDLKLRKSRTRREGKLLENAGRAGISVPRVYDIDLREKRIVMEFIDGRLLKDLIPKAKDDEIKKIAEEAGRVIAKLHTSNIVHNDLTTSNMILGDDKLFLIDFGLGATSTRIEDKAMDLVVLRKSLNAAHSNRFDLIWDSLLKGYGDYSRCAEVLERIKTIEKRGRYT
jgi:Kae1-associated kinase Bud32